MSRFDELDAFVAVVEEAGFSSAAKKLGLSKSYVSKRISKLEERLGVRLLQRTTRQISLTEEGRAYYERGVEILESLAQAESVIQDQHGTPKGVLRLSVPISFGQRFLAKPIAQFLMLYPEVSVEVSFLDTKVDVVEDGYDLVIRIGKLEDSSLFVRKLMHTNSVLCASPRYLEENGVPEAPEDLRDHECLRYAYQFSGAMWRFHRMENEELIEVSVKPRGRMTANNGDALLASALEGVGLVLLPDFFVGEEIQRGALVPVLPTWGCGDNGVWAMYPHNRHLSAKVKLFIEFLEKRFKDSTGVAHAIASAAQSASK